MFTRAVKSAKNRSRAFCCVWTDWSEGVLDLITCRSVWNAFIIVFSFKISSRSANPDLEGYCCFGLVLRCMKRSGRVCVTPSHLIRRVWAKIPRFDKRQKKGIGNIEEVLPHFYFLSLLKDGIMKSIEAWTSRKHHGCLRKSFHFPPFFPPSFMDREDGPVPSLFMPSFTVRNRRKEKWGDIEKLEEAIYFFFFCPLTLPHYRSVCWRRDRNGAL